LDSQAGLQPIYPVEEVLDGDQVSDLSGNLLLVTRQGDKLNVTCTGMPLYDKEANRLGAVVTFLDVTEKVNLTEESLKARNLTSLGELAGGIAHNFNNILTAVMGNISLARLELYEPDVVNELLEEAEKATIRAKELARQLLTFARGNSPHKEICRIDILLKNTTDYLLQGSKMHLEFDLPNNLWSVMADQIQLSQVIQNLVLNAEDAMPEGGQLQIKALNVTLAAGQIPLLNVGNYVQITIQDHGSGIRPEDLPRILDPYFTTKFLGKGLGLPICYSIIRKHEGQMLVESKFGKGTMVHLYLPAMVTNQSGKENP
jgi:signal transduction histidine kinase